MFTPNTTFATTFEQPWNRGVYNRETGDRTNNLNGHALTNINNETNGTEILCYIGKSSTPDKSCY